MSVTGTRAGRERPFFPLAGCGRSEKRESERDWPALVSPLHLHFIVQQLESQTFILVTQRASRGDSSSLPWSTANRLFSASSFAIAYYPLPEERGKGEQTKAEIAQRKAHLSPSGAAAASAISPTGSI